MWSATLGQWEKHRRDPSARTADKAEASAEMSGVSLESFKGWLLGPFEALLHHMSLGSKRYPEVYTDKAPLYFRKLKHISDTCSQIDLDSDRE